MTFQETMKNPVNSCCCTPTQGISRALFLFSECNLRRTIVKSENLVAHVNETIINGLSSEGKNYAKFSL